MTLVERWSPEGWVHHPTVASPETDRREPLRTRDANNILIVDDLLRFEHLAEDWSAFSAKHGIERELVHVNSSARQADAEQHMTQRTRDMISEYYREDFERFGYER